MVLLLCAYFFWSCLVALSPWYCSIAWSVVSRIVDRWLRVVVVGWLLNSWLARWPICPLLMLGWGHHVVCLSLFWSILLGLLSTLGCSWAWLWSLYAHFIRVYWISFCASDYTIWHVLACDVFSTKSMFHNCYIITIYLWQNIPGFYSIVLLLVPLL